MLGPIRIALFFGFLALAAWTAFAQLALTWVLGTLYISDGTKPTGELTVLWRPFTNVAGYAVGGGSKQFPITNGAVDVSLVSNTGSTPTATCYEITIRLKDTGVTLNEIWVIPASGPVTPAQVRDSAKTPPCPSVK
jgi:hypothetical protein